jgi:hypothetical protein
LNLINQQIFFSKEDLLNTILQLAPELEMLQIQGISAASELEQHTKLKQLLLLFCNLSPVNLIENCPNLEIFASKSNEE